MNNYERNKQTLLQLLQRTIDFAKERKNDTLVDSLNKVMQHLNEGQMYIVVCGEFKQGKSSFINALLDEAEDLCPVDVDVTTSIATTIAYSESEKITVLLGEPGGAIHKKDLLSRDQIRDYVTEQGNPGNKRKARMLAIQLPNEQLKAGMVVVDTPGVGGLNAAHTEITYTFLSDADVALFVSDAQEPLSELELDFIAERIARHCQDIIFIVTKKDQNAEFQVIVEDNRQKLATKLNRSLDDIIIIPVSSLLKRDYLEFQDEEALASSNFPALETLLWQHLNDGRGRILLAKAGTELGRALGELRLPIQTELFACQESDKQRLAELEQSIQEKNQRLRDLLDKNATWHGLLFDRLQDIHSKISQEFQQGFSEIRQRVPAYLEDKTLLSKPEQIVDLLQADMSGLMAEMQKNLEQEAATLQRTLEHETELDLNLYHDAFSTNALVALPKQMETKKQGMWSKSLDVARNAKSSGNAGGLVLGILGGVIGGAIGLFAGGVGVLPGIYVGAALGGALGEVAGLATGTRNSLKAMQQREIAEIRTFLLAFVSEQEANLNNTFGAVIRDMERFLRNDLTDQLSREKRSVEEALAGLKNSRNLDANQMAARISTLSVLRRRIDYIQQELEKVLNAATAETPSQAEAEGEDDKDGPSAESWADE